MRKASALLVAVTLLTGCTTVSIIPLVEQDRIIFLGDSITAGGARPGGYVTLTREGIQAAYADSGIEVIGAGISGNKVGNLQKRLEKDVLSKNPSVVVIYIGINDVWHWKGERKGTTKEDFDSGLRDIIGRIQESGARVILCTPTVIGEKTDGSNKYDPMLEEYSEISRNVAHETGAQLLDLRNAFISHLKENNPENLPKGILTRDTVHLNAEGNRFLADLMLEALGVSDS